MPGPKPRPRRIDTDPSTATNGVRPGGEASTRKAVQVPKKAPVAGNAPSPVALSVQIMPCFSPA